LEKSEKIIKKRDIFKFDFNVLFTTLRSKMIYIVFFTLLFFFFSGIAAKMLIKDVWEVRTVLLRNKKNMALQTDVPYLYQDLDMNTVVQTIKLRRNLFEVIKRLNLNSTPEKLFRQITIEPGRKSNIIHILTKDSDVHTAINIGNTIADVFVNSFVPIQNSSAEKIYNYYTQQKEDLIKKLIELEKESDLFNKEKKVISIESETSIKFEQLKELELKKIENSMLITDYKTKLADFSSEIAGLEEEVVLTSTVKSSPERQLNLMKEELAKLLQKYTDDNPKVIKLKTEIENFEKKISQNKVGKKVADEVTYGSNSIRQSMIIESNNIKALLKSAEKKVSEYDKKIIEIQEGLQYLSKSQAEYFTIKRQLEMFKELLKTVESRIMEAKIAKESNISDFEILEYASEPPFPMGSKRKLLAVAAGIIGFIFSLLFIALKELTDFTFKSPFDIKEQAGIPCVGNLPDKDAVKQDLFYAQFQVFMRDILDSAENKVHPRLFSFGSDSDESGKSFIINETVQFLGTTGRNILVIETVYDLSDDISDNIINNSLVSGDMGSLKLLQIDKNVFKTFFLADSSTLKTVIEKNSLESFLRSLNRFDTVLWELFRFSFNIQLAADIISMSDKFYLISRFRHSDLDKVEKIINFLNENNIFK